MNHLVYHSHTSAMAPTIELKEGVFPRDAESSTEILKHNWPLLRPHDLRVISWASYTSTIGALYPFEVVSAKRTICYCGAYVISGYRRSDYLLP
jgi:hypothetical protein